MAAYEIPGMRFSAVAGAKVERRRFVSVDADEKGITATSATPVIGVSTVDADLNEVLEIATGIVMVEAEAAIAAGTEVEVGTDGKALTAAGTNPKVGVAITGASAAGALLSILL